MKKAITKLDNLVFTAYLLLVASLSIQKPAVTAIFQKSVSATDLIFPIVLLLMLGLLVFHRRLPRWNRSYLYFAAYILAFLIASFFAANVSSALVKTFATVYLVGLAVLSIEIVDSPRRLIWVIFSWLAGALIPIGIGIATLFSYYIWPNDLVLSNFTYHHGAVPIGNFPRLSSTFISASMFCNYLTATAMLWLAAKHFIRLPIWIWWCGFFGLLLCAVFTVSAGLGAFLFGLTLWLFRSEESGLKARLLLITGFAILISSLAATLLAFQPHSTALYSYVAPILNVEIIPSSRFLVWTDALKTIANNLLIGNGPGSPSTNVVYQNTSGQFSLLTDAHNSFLNIAAQTGLVGLMAFVAMVGQLLISGYRGRLSSPWSYALVVAFVCGFVLQGLTGSFEDARHMWVLIGIMAAAFAIEPETSSNSSAKI